MKEKKPKAKKVTKPKASPSKAPKPSPKKAAAKPKVAKPKKAAKPKSTPKKSKFSLASIPFSLLVHSPVSCNHHTNLNLSSPFHLTEAPAAKKVKTPKPKAAKA